MRWKKKSLQEILCSGYYYDLYKHEKTTLEDIYLSLRDGLNEITIDETIRIKAFKALENMHILSKRRD